ncbi:MAG: hypothetical protein QNJ13_18285, partial [Paracoccaceae bacterium]|nr:hypothetical protein [Paracoccaceae bacterium]
MQIAPYLSVTLSRGVCGNPFQPGAVEDVHVLNRARRGMEGTAAAIAAMTGAFDGHPVTGDTPVPGLSRNL